MGYMSEALYFNRIQDLYARGRYREVDQLIGQYYRLFSDGLGLSYRFRLLAAAQSGQPERAWQILQAAVCEDSCWYAPDWLMQEPALLVLRSHPEFESLVELCREREAEVQRSHEVELQIFRPDDFNSELVYPLLFGIHGNLENARLAAAAWEPDLWDGWVTAWPESSRSAFSDGYFWESVEQGLVEIRGHYDYLRAEGRWAAIYTLIGGYAEGAALALRTAWDGIVPAVGVILVAPVLPVLPAGTPPAGLHVYVVVGEEDTAGMVDGRALAERLEALAVPYEIEVRPGVGHLYPPDFESSLVRAMEFCMDFQAEDGCLD